MAIPVREEQEWARKYPVPNSDAVDVVLSLWNYPVARTDLTAEHRAALKKFLAGDYLKIGLTRTMDTLLFVTGHASDSGDGPANVALSRDRAQKVARFLISEGFPSAQIRVEWSGSSEPIDTGSSGYAAARNRRVELERFVPPVVEQLPPTDLDPVPRPEPQFKIPQGSGPSSLTIDIPIEFELPPIRTAEVLIGGKIGGVLKLKIDDKGGGWGGGLAIKDGKLTAKFEQKLTDDLKGKISFESPGNGKGAALKVGGEYKLFGTLDTHVGLQSKLPNFVYAEFSFEEARMPDVELGDVHVSMTFKPTLKIDVGPGPAMLARLGVTAGGAATVAAGALLGSALLVVGTAKAVDYAKQESLNLTRLLARRSGVAARVSYEILGLPAETPFAEIRMDWRRTLDGMGPPFDAGVASVNAMLKDPSVREQKRTEWARRYANGSQNFTEIQTRVFEAIGGYENGDEMQEPAARL
jgi:hypothetical protein